MGGGMRWIIALMMAVGSIITYFSTSEYNPITEEEQRVSMTAEQEMALGLQAAPQMVQQYGGLSGGAGGQPEFMSTHTDPGNRIERIRESIQKYSRQTP